MAGKSSRFYDAGYTLPKFMLDVHGVSVFEIAVSSFKRYFSKNLFVFIINQDSVVEDFIKNKITTLGIKNYKIVSLAEPTKGQAETVWKGTDLISDKKQGLVVFNIDTFRPDYIFPESLETADGYVEVFKGKGSHWSFIETDTQDLTKVIRTTEKERISDLCSSGLYYFKSIEIFEEMFLYYKNNNILTRNEYYVAPMYNYLIQKGSYISFELISIDNLFFIGTPEEYLHFKGNMTHDSLLRLME